MRGLDALVGTNLVLATADQLGIRLTHLQLQKVLYFTQALFLVEARHRFLDTEFEAWRYGPVCREVYQELKSNGDGPLSGPIDIKDPVTGRVLNLEHKLEAVFELRVRKCVNYYGRLSAAKLVEMSHARGGAWDCVVAQAKNEANVGMRISDDLIVDRYRYHWTNRGPAIAKDISGEDSPITAHGFR